MGFACGLREGIRLHAATCCLMGVGGFTTCDLGLYHPGAVASWTSSWHTSGIAT
jgi:hypothetical protein